MTSRWARAMQEISAAGLRDLYRNIEETILLDFPDHPNVGDSAIALGELAFYHREKIRVASIHTIGTKGRHLAASQSLSIHGGGNLGGIYEHHEAHRLETIRALDEKTPLIQLPQSAPYIQETSARAYREAADTHHHLRFAARDTETLESLRVLGLPTALTPDAFHAVGPLNGGTPGRDHIFLLRKDIETTGASDESGSVDWPGDLLLDRIGASARKRAHIAPLGAKVLNPSRAAWRRIAARRFQRGAAIITSADTVVTDRLHAALIALHYGRRVVVIDNINHKLTRYFQAWERPAGTPAIEFAEDARDARRILRKGRPI